MYWLLGELVGSSVPCGLSHNALLYHNVGCVSIFLNLPSLDLLELLGGVNLVGSADYLHLLINHLSQKKYPSGKMAGVLVLLPQRRRSKF